MDTFDLKPIAVFYIALTVAFHLPYFNITFSKTKKSKQKGFHFCSTHYSLPFTITSLLLSHKIVILICIFCLLKQLILALYFLILPPFLKFISTDKHLTFTHNSSSLTPPLFLASFNKYCKLFFQSLPIYGFNRERSHTVDAMGRSLTIIFHVIPRDYI